MTIQEALDTLGLSELPDVDVLKMAFRQKALQSHPDKGGNDEMFRKVNEAHGVLLKEIRRVSFTEDLG